MKTTNKKIVYEEGKDLKTLRGEIPINWEKDASNFLQIRFKGGGEVFVAKKCIISVKDETQEVL